MSTARSLAALSSARATRHRCRRAGGAWPPRAVAAGRATAEPTPAPEHVRRLVAEFDPAVPLASAVTPPSGWYTDPDFLRLELDRVFLRGWQAVGHIWQVKNPNDFFTGSDAVLQGWTYGLDGTLLKATRISGIKNFNKNVNIFQTLSSAYMLVSPMMAAYASVWKQDFGLVPIKVAAWGPFVLARFDDGSTEGDVGDVVGDEWLGSASSLLSTNGIDNSLPHICRREYIINCNWKVFCDNYLDGGYHVPYAHGALASGLQLQSYETLVLSINLLFFCRHFLDKMLFRYGPWMDTNLAVPLGSTKCKVVFDYFLDKSLLDDQNFIERSLKDSEQVQMEDIALCEGVQRGLESPAYSVGRYAPSVEMAMHHFHCLLHANLSG
ncbi:Choline monooxygenase, chloroplastic [Dichanthelium oligosanthes]|uniref:Choline monooxygenase, chloroplastic n=1 Tax=Dichanthelium oligosanthes TaxID=888268 RepID=A0A1E5WJ72_9POAL|nr:Choline monooxygenase, chloroplastic [Dichanthelium oligosanthes]